MGIPVKTARSIFLDAIENHPPKNWGAFLASACDDDLQIRAQVEKLLRVHDPNHPFMDQPATELLGEFLDLETDASVESMVGCTIGRYKLLEKIGEGGMGTVYMASQLHPIQRKVALKIIKAGMDTREVLARFDVERQSLAMMEHPNIAKVLDGGATDSGRPYIVMELVRGKVVLLYSDSERVLQSWSVDSRPITNIPHAIEFSPDSQRIAWAGNRELKVATISNPDAAPQAFKLPSTFYCMAWDPDSKGVYIGGLFDKLLHLDFITGELTTTATIGVPACTLEMTRDGEHLLSGHDDGSVRILNLGNGSMKTMFIHRAQVRSFAMSHDGRLGASADSNGNISIWFVDTAEQIGLFNPQPIWTWGYNVPRPALIFTPNDDRLQVLFEVPGHKMLLQTWELRPDASR